jgi:UDP-2,4-diacetamido-2,4,6-trideoxy-beta-L-altropyranose hydrolase
MKTKLSLRRAEAGDSRLLWEWANDPVTRQQSFSSALIPWEDHERWFERKLQDRSCHLFIALDEQTDAIGQVRFDAAGPGEVVISVSIAPAARGRGYGAAAIAEACAALRPLAAPVTVIAFIRGDNVASQRAFARAGFSAPESVDYQGHAAVRQVLQLTEAGVV